MATNVPTNFTPGSSMGIGHQQHNHHFEVDLSYITSKIIGKIIIYFEFEKLI